MAEPKETPENPEIIPEPAPSVPEDSEESTEVPPDEPDLDAEPSEDEPREALFPDDPVIAENKVLKVSLGEMEGRLRLVSNAYRDVQAEMAAFRQRTERLQDDRDRQRKGEVVRAVFEPVQNLRRSLEIIRRMEVPEDVPRGLQMVLDQFQTALKGLGLEEIPCEGQLFDPNVHEALATAPVLDPARDGVVLQAFEAGWRIGSQVIQPARVIIGRYVEPEA